MKKRIDKIRKKIKNHDGLLISSVLNIFYLTGFTGFSNEEREGYLLLTKNKNYILTDARYKEVVGKFLLDFELIEISGNINFNKCLKQILKAEKINKLLIDDDNINSFEYKTIKKIVKTFSDENLIEKLRELKDDEEIKNIKRACKLADLTFKYILTQIKLGVTEKEISQKIIIFILLKNAAVSFNPIVAFSQNSSSPHHVANNKKLRKNSIVLLDFGVKVNNYCSDMTRTVFFGKATKEQKNIYNTVLKSQKMAIEYISSHKNPKTKIADKIARDYILSQNFPTIPHSLGHGIGLEVHENPKLSPKSEETIKKGMVFSIEPGVYIPDFGGVRIEDLFLYDGINPLLISKSNRRIIELRP